jgi:hypothetical protein
VQTFYRGWIPTVTGRLSFSHFGDPTARRCRGLSRTDGNKRYLLIKQIRKTWDVMLPAWAAFEKALGLRGSAQFVCLAETFDVQIPGKPEDKQAELRGKVFIIADRERWSKRVKREFSKCLSALEEYEAFPTPQSIQTVFAPKNAAFNDIYAENCAFQCSFSLHRNGVLNVTVSETDM